jgi:hypothetical protein
MRTVFRLSIILLTVLPSLAGDVRTINATCEAAILKAEVLAAQRKWWPDRPDPRAPVLNIRTHSNFAKQVLLPLGKVWSHEKVGELAFDEREKSCRVTSNGRPADVVLSDLSKAEFPPPQVALEPSSPQPNNARESDQKPTRKCAQGTHWGNDANGDPICVWSR